MCESTEWENDRMTKRVKWLKVRVVSSLVYLNSEPRLNFVFESLIEMNFKRFYYTTTVNWHRRPRVTKIQCNLLEKLIIIRPKLIPRLIRNLRFYNRTNLLKESHDIFTNEHFSFDNFSWINELISRYLIYIHWNYWLTWTPEIFCN